MTLTATDFESRIDKNWQNSAEGVLRTAEIVLEAEAHLKGDELRDFRDGFYVDVAGYRRLKRIGKDKRLYRPDVRTRLPKSYATLTELTRLNDEQFDDALRQLHINPGLTRAQAIALRTGKQPKVIHKEFPNTRELLTVRIDADLKDPKIACKVRDAIADLIDEMEEIDGISGIHIDDKALAEKLENGRKRKRVKKQADSKIDSSLDLKLDF